MMIAARRGVGEGQATKAAGSKGQTASLDGGYEWCFEINNVTHVTLLYNDLSNSVNTACESGNAN